MSWTDQAVIVYFNYGGNDDWDPIFDLSLELNDLLKTSDAGNFDGNEIAFDSSEGSFYMYGPDANYLFATVRPVLESADFLKGAIAVLQLGPSKDGVEREKIVLGSSLH